MTFPFAFTIPYLVLACFHFDLAEGEHFGNFEIYQPVSFTLNRGSVLHDTFINADAYCGDYVIKATGDYRVHDLSIEMGRIR